MSKFYFVWMLYNVSKTPYMAVEIQVRGRANVRFLTIFQYKKDGTVTLCLPPSLLGSDT